LAEPENNWGAWNGIGGYLGIGGGHAGGGLHGGWEEHGKTHPEWFALQPDGTRDQSAAGGRWQLCVSNPALIDHVADDIIGRLAGKAQPRFRSAPTTAVTRIFVCATPAKNSIRRKGRRSRC